MFILFDANTWISQVGLQSQNGAAVRFFARQHNATIAIPEVVQMEVEEVLTKRMLELRKRVEDGHRQLLPLFGQLQNLSLPSEDDVRNAVKNIIPDIDVPTRHIPLNLEAARSSMVKLMRQVPPSKKKEQFRDGVIWAHCLELLSEGDVYFISGDSDFFDNANFTKGLASELTLEMKSQSKKYNIFVKRTLDDLLGEIQIPFELSKRQIFDEMYRSRYEDMAELLDAHGFTIGESIEGNVKCFATEKADRVHFTFDLARPCQDSTKEGRKKCVLKVKGVGFVDPLTKNTSDVQLSNVRLDYPEWEPGRGARGSVYVSAHFNSLAQHHSLRIPLDSP